MTNFNDAAQGIKNFAGRMQGFLDTAKFLEDLGDLEVVEKNLLERRDVAARLLNEAATELESKKSEVVSANQGIQVSLKNASDIENQAKAESEKSISEAKAEANRIIDLANHQKSEVEKQIIFDTQKLDAVNAEIVEAQQSLDALNTKISDAKEAVKKLLGA